MSATGFEEPDLTYTLPTAAPASAPPPPPAHNAEGSSRSGVEVKVVRIEIPKSRVLRMNENCKRYLYQVHSVFLGPIRLLKCFYGHLGP